MSNIMRRLSQIKSHVELSNSLNLTDLSIHAENFFRDLLNLLGYSFVNTNFAKQNEAHIDLIDKESKIAIQVTAQNDNTKISETISGFFGESRYSEFNLKILLISKDSKDYRTDFTENGKYSFNHKEDIIDLGRLLKIIEDKETPIINKVSEFLEYEINGSKTNTECNEVETIMSLIAFLSNAHNRQQTVRRDIIDPERKVSRFATHGKYLLERYTETCVLYSRPLDEARTNIDSMSALTISAYLKDESDEVLTKHNDNPKSAIRELVSYFYDKLSTHGKRFDKQAIQFYLIDEMIQCNVFPLSS